MEALYTLRVKLTAKTEAIRERLWLQFDADKIYDQDDVTEMLYKELQKRYKSFRWFMLDGDYHSCQL